MLGIPGSQPVKFCDIWINGVTINSKRFFGLTLRLVPIVFSVYDLVYSERALFATVLAPD